ncbi:MAG: heme a synthase [Chthoniobacter sp.]|nr:heme a synthase [Chthoniobacter sp.]
MLINEPGSNSSAIRLWLARYAKFVVAMTFVLILIGGHTTTAGAGMAFPDWPLSHGSVNPDGWWENFLQRLEHGHRLTAETVGLLIGILCAWIWRSKWSVPLAAGMSVLLAVAAKTAGAEAKMVAHVGLWSSALTFAGLILWQTRRDEHAETAPVRWLAFTAFVGVLVQATLGGLRVTIESGGDPGTATAFRVFHGCFAQAELCLLVAIATMLSPVWARIASGSQLRSVARLGWITSALIFGQLIVGATMRHLGAGLAITTWPQASADGSWLPKMHNSLIDLNFAHTRAGAALVALLTVILSLRGIGYAAGDVRIIRPAALLIALVAAQCTLGLLVIWNGRPPIITTLHVVNGAALLAATVLLAARAGRAGWLSADRTVSTPGLQLVGVAA